jgi:hypothetical protein
MTKEEIIKRRIELKKQLVMLTLKEIKELERIPVENEDCNEISECKDTSSNP